MTEEQTTVEASEEQAGDITGAAENAEHDSGDATGKPEEEATGENSPSEEQDTFPREYVEKLRDENAKYRQRAQKSDELAHRLHRALVEADGRLADPTDLNYAEEHLEDAESLSEAIGELLRAKPHLAARKPAGNIGQGAHGTHPGAVDLAGLLRAGAN